MFYKLKSDYYDFNLIAVIILIMCFGLIMLYSTSSYMAQIKEGDDMFYFKKQALYSIGCLFLAIVVSYLDYHILAKLAFPIYLGAIFLMALVKTPLGVSSHGARRWLKLGVQFQPAEIAKIAVIVTLSYMIVHMGKKVKTLKAAMTLLGLGGIQALCAYVLTENLSTAIIIFGITVGLVFIAHPRTKPFVIVGLVVVVLLAILVYSLSHMDKSSNFRLRRIQVWLHPEDYAGDDGYQTVQALYAIGSGGFFGRGLGNSIQKLGSVPEAQNDMIFSIICEELGVFGAIMVLSLFAYLLYRLFFIAQNAPDMFGSLLVSGIFVHIALQVIMNVAVVLNLMPNTGVTLPFISYGGTSILFLMSEMGLALSVARQIKFKEPEFIL
ncbi:putative lipid II flippase FtsW [Blautia glucerasea]|uniref:FtsW/RodA/SpoVE family cell cycle protein n=1 Tax=Blautia glucerasea TaxID=536633 RepID=UPI001D02B9D0|nr:putative peptidoglycan glycosyltransferase FtsW [Blautia glucerasea]MCB5386404.1 putative lipid II flippase FtsW [Blautia glucerasea]MCB5420759.1 putative lipid II flippase FtsW [Blautia luti]